MGFCSVSPVSPSVRVFPSLIIVITLSFTSKFRLYTSLHNPQTNSIYMFTFSSFRFVSGALNIRTFVTEKCVFNKRNMSFFGHNWNLEGVTADPKKLDAIRKMKAPEKAEEVRSLLWMAGYVYRMIPNYATITEPLRRITTSKVPWEWGREQKTSL